MKLPYILATLAATTLMSACAPSGSYDSNGEYHAYGKDDSYRQQHAMSDTPRDTMHYDASRDIHYYDEPVRTTTIIYDRPGYYDANGYYITWDDGPHVPDEFFPPAGKCRIWIEGRPISEQPPVQSCHSVRHNVPGGGYVMYGG